MSTITPLLGANPFGYALTHPCFLWLYCLLGFLVGLIAAYYIWHRAYHARQEAAEAESLRLREGILIAKRAAPALEKTKAIENGLSIARGESKILKGHVARLSKQVDKGAATLVKVKANYEQERDAAQGLRRDFHTLNSNFHQAQSEVTTLNGRVRHLSASVEEEQSAAHAKEQELVQLKATTTETVTSMDREFTALQSDLKAKDHTVEEKDQEIVDLKRRLAEQSTAYGTVETQATKIQKERDEAQAALTNAKAKVAALEGQQVDLKTKVVALEGQQVDLKAKDRVIDERDRQIGELKKALSEQSTANGAAETQVARLQKERDEAQAALTSAKSNARASEGQAEETAKLREALERTKTEYQTVSDQLGDLQERHERLKREQQAASKNAPSTGKGDTFESNTAALGFLAGSGTSDSSLIEDPSLGLIYESRPTEIDDLKEIKGVANVLEKRLNEFGIYRYKQIAHWSDAHEQEFSERLSFKDRIQRDEWRKQATNLHQEKYGEVLKVSTV